MKHSITDIKKLLDKKVEEYNQILFIKNDPISIPHQYTLKQDIEISAFFAAMFAWGNRTTIINKTKELMQYMDNAPYQFILQHSEQDLKKMNSFVHRTFNSNDLFYFIHFFKKHYQEFDSLENAFIGENIFSMKERLIHFHQYFFFEEHLIRTKKHVSTPLKNSACKRLNMFLRWMVRKDKMGVDFGIWHHIKMNELICPLDVHVCNVSFRLGLLQNKKSNWLNAEKLTDTLKTFDPNDPIKYDFALFALGAEERFK